MKIKFKKDIDSINIFNIIYESNDLIINTKKLTYKNIVESFKLSNKQIEDLIFNKLSFESDVYYKHFEKDDFFSIILSVKINNEEDNFGNIFFSKGSLILTLDSILYLNDYKQLLKELNEYKFNIDTNCLDEFFAKILANRLSS